MLVKERLLNKNYKFSEDAPLFNLTLRQRDAREMFLKDVFKRHNQIFLTTCPYCGEISFTKISEIDARALPSEIVICDSCDGCFKNGVLNSEANRYHYENLSYALRGKEPSKESMERLFWMRVKSFAYPRYYFIFHFLRLNPKEDLIAEFGCNDGANLWPWLKNDFRVLGIDLDSELIEFGKGKGLNLDCGDISNYNLYANKPKLIILSHVLEHVMDINAALERLSRSITPDGYIFIEVPGIKVWGLKNALAYFDVEHNYNLDLNTLKRLLEKHGFKILYGDEYIRILCTSRKNTLPFVPRSLPLSFTKIKASFLRNSIKILNPRNRKLYDLLKAGEDNDFRIRALAKSQNSYFKNYYSLFRGQRRELTDARQ